jgi:predicted metal-dependent hydrolase
VRKPTGEGKLRMREEIRRWAEKIGVKPKRIQIQRMTRKWASCSETGRVCFSTQLLDEEPGFREVVIVHELLHLQVPNHGKLFKSLMNAYLPEWELRVQGRAGRICGSARTNATGGRHQ